MVLGSPYTSAEAAAAAALDDIVVWLTGCCCSRPEHAFDEQLMNIFSFEVFLRGS